MFFGFCRHWRSRRVFGVLLRTLVWLQLYEVIMAQADKGCPEFTCSPPPSSFSTRPRIGEESCYQYGTLLTVDCQIGFEPRRGPESAFNVVCYRDNTWQWSDSCVIDIFSVIIAGIVTSLVVCTFFVVMYCIFCRRKRTGKGKDAKNAQDQIVDGT